MHAGGTSVIVTKGKGLQQAVSKVTAKDPQIRSAGSVIGF